MQEKEKVVYRQNGILFSLKKEEILALPELENIMLSEIHQVQKDRTTWSPLYMEPEV
jgi:hypothetical protein